MTLFSQRDDRLELKRIARQAGLFYLLLAVVAPFAILYVPSQIKVAGASNATINNIIQKEFLFRTGIIAQLISQALSVFVVLMLYKLFRNVNAHKAKAMVALALAGIPIVFISEAMNLTAIMIAKGAILKSFESAQLQELVMLFLRIHDNGIMIVQIFWGLWLIPFGELIIRSGFIPQIFGWLLILNGIAYLLASIVFVLWPEKVEVVSTYTFPIYFGELAIILWLLIAGAKQRRPAI